MSIQSQIHNRFATFISTPGTDGLLDDSVHLAVESFAKGNSTLAIKSVGVEYLESKDRVVLTLGYVDGAQGYPVKLHCKSLGQLGEKLDPKEISAAMEKAASTVPDVICHEFYVDKKGEFFAVFLSHG
jgi:hypothetical protein